MTFDEMVTFVRSQSDSDVIDAPTATLTVHARIAYNDILARRAAWDHLEVHLNLATVIGQQEYTYPTVGAQTIDRIYSITTTTGLTKRLVYITRQDADMMYDQTGNTGDPEAYTLYNNKIVLYPTPSSVQTLKVHGFRVPATWPAALGDAPDLPASFHDAIAWYMLSGYYMSQEDQQLAGAYLQEYQSMVQSALDGVSAKNNRPRPKIMGGQHIRTRPFMDRVAGMLES